MEKTNNFQSDLDRESLLRVRDKYEDVKTLIGELSYKLTKVSSHIEAEFLSAYRVHMLSVQEELRDLRDQVVKAEEALNEDNEVSALESEVKWFTDETLRLRNQSAAMKADIKHILERIAALKEQRAYLGDQLKTTLKRTRIAQADMELSVVGKEDTLRMLEEKEHNSNINTNYDMSAETKNGDEYSDIGGDGASAARGQGEEVEEVDELGPEPSFTKPGVTPGVTGKSMKKSYSTSKLPPLSKMSKTFRGPEDVLLKQSKSAAELGPRQSHIEELEALNDARLPLELDLEDAIKSTFEEIIDRKVKSVQSSVSRKFEGKNKPSNHWDLTGAAGGITGLGLQHFSDNDRLSAMTLFVSKPQVFAKVVAILSTELGL